MARTTETSIYDDGRMEWTEWPDGKDHPAYLHFGLFEVTDEGMFIYSSDEYIDGEVHNLWAFPAPRNWEMV